MWRVRKQFEETGQKRSNVQGSTTAVPKVTDAPTGRSSEPREMLFNPVTGKQDLIHGERSPHSLPRKERPKSPKGASSFGTEYTPRSRARETILKKREFLSGVRKIVNTKQTLKASNADVHRDFADASNPYMHSGAGNNAAEEWIQSVDGRRIETIRFPLYYPKTVHLKKYDQVTPFLDAALTPCHHPAHMFVFIEKVYYSDSTVWKAVSVTQMSCYGMFHG